METKVKDHLSLLGKIVKDIVTGCTGVVSSVSFDLYGCIQVVVQIQDTEKLGESDCFDVARLVVIQEEPVMNPPNFDFGHVAEGKYGPAAKPTAYQRPMK
ncbi:hypothetical protein [Synechococcus phage BUCT-ZZ01]|nr:hypothetical protein [Synechococcus phage BUCT-ZZ01]